MLEKLLRCKVVVGFERYGCASISRNVVVGVCATDTLIESQVAVGQLFVGSATALNLLILFINFLC